MRQQSYDVLIKGDKSVVKTDAGWQTPAEMQAADQGGGGGFSPSTMVVFRIQSFKTPVATLQDIVSKLDNVTAAADGSMTADLSSEVATTLLTPARRPQPAPAAGATLPRLPRRSPSPTPKATSLFGSKMVS